MEHFCAPSTLSRGHKTISQVREYYSKNKPVSFLNKVYDLKSDSQLKLQNHLLIMFPIPNKGIIFLTVPTSA